MSLYEELCATPYRTVFNILTGVDSVSPCPVCRDKGTTLNAGEYVGFCYSCGKLKLETLYDLVFQPRQQSGTEA